MQALFQLSYSPTDSRSIRASNWSKALSNRSETLTGFQMLGQAQPARGIIQHRCRSGTLRALRL